LSGSGRPDGAGLGLAIARELAQAHGGDVVLAETGPTGTTFEVRLPGAPEPAAAPQRRPKAAEPKSA
jgi:signal transduction histidine kinase